MLNKLKQLGSVPRSQDATDLLDESLVVVEQRVEPAKKAAQVIHKKLQGCLQSPTGLEAEKRMKKLPLMMLSISMAESLKDFDAESSMRRVLEMCCFMEKMLANVRADFEMKMEKEVLEPLNKLSYEDLPEILKNKKQFAKLTTDWQNARNKCQASTGPQAKQDGLREEVEEAWRKLVNIKDQYSADLYHFATKEDHYASHFITLLELQAEYHRRSHEFLEQNIKELKDNHSSKDPPVMLSGRKVYGEPLLSHLTEGQREIASPIQECVHMLLSSGMEEEGLFRLAAAASVLKRLKGGLDQGPVDHQEFSRDPHAVAGALKCYLRELPEPLMTFELYSDWFKAAGEKETAQKLEQFRTVLKKLPPENYNNLRYLVQFLSLLSEQQAVNRMSPSNIAIVLGPNLLWPRTEGEVGVLDMAAASSVQVVTVVEPLIQYSSSLFPEAMSFDIPDPPGSGSGPPPPASEDPPSLPENTTVTRTSSSSSSSSHTPLSSRSSSASVDGGVPLSAGLHRRTTSWDSPQPAARASLLISPPMQTATTPLYPSLDPGQVCPQTGGKDPAPHKPRRSVVQRGPAQPAERPAVCCTKPSDPKAPPAPPAPASHARPPPAPGARVQPAVGGPGRASPSPAPKKPPAKRGVRAPRCPPPLPPLAEVKQ